MKSQLIAIVAAVLVVGCGESPKDIWEAARKGNIEAVKQHLVAGTDVNAKDRHGRTPLYVVAGSKEVVELLIAKGADVNAKDNNRRTPLHRAANRGHTEIVELLIAKGADVNAIAGQYMDHATPLDWAIKYKRTETAALLRKHGGKTKKELEADTAIIDLLRKHGGKTGDELKAEGK
jgi:ankyrin repeat protein